MVGSGAFDDFGKGMVSILATIHHYYSATRKSEVISCPVASVLPTFAIQYRCYRT
ncbi:hypothetical protein [Okeania sp. SIO2B9]|uniref:hypothetical protein n=1 Tax=Okeania sp. SIO2B9 TaxID=2607782 RepID=UPI00257A52ED|nr:hypothetical protein [Okeania sp. SIO2B9]